MDRMRTLRVVTRKLTKFKIHDMRRLFMTSYTTVVLHSTTVFSQLKPE